MLKKKADEKTVDATVAEDGKEDDVLTAQDEGGGGVDTTPDAPDLEDDKTDAVPDPEKGLKPKKKKPTKDEEIMAYGIDIRTVGPEMVIVNRAAIVFLAKQLMTPPDLEDFKTLYPSLFKTLYPSLF